MAYCGTDWVVLGYFDGEFATPDQLQASALMWISNNNKQIQKYKVIINKYRKKKQITIEKLKQTEEIATPE